jgi:aspartate aminotransferase
MALTINPLISSLKGSSTLKITALTKKLKKEGKDIVNFAAGEPDFDTPAFVKDEAKRAIDEGFTKYTPSSGMLELREAIARKLNEENKIACQAQNIIVTCGAKYAIYAAILTVAGKGDQVIIASPYWVSYPEMVRLSGAKIKVIATNSRNSFKIQPKDLQKALTSKTKLLILNYPNNPTGMTYTEEELTQLFEVIRDKGVYILSDEIYEKLIYDGRTHTSFATISGAAKNTLTVNGFSKSFSMTGWRIGYLAADEKIINEASKIIDHTTSCVSSISQRAALVALKNTSWQDTLRAEFEKRRNFLWNGLTDCKKLVPFKSEGTFYMFCDIRKTGLSSEEFASRLLEKKCVSVIPADSFDAEGYVRLSFATALEDIEKGLMRIKQFLNEL